MAAPRTWIPDEVVTAALLNTELRDKFLANPADLATAAGQTVFSTGAGAIAMVHGAEYKTADESVNNSTTLQNDDHLAWAVGANEIWAFRAFLYFTIASGDPGVKTAFTVPAASSGYRSRVLMSGATYIQNTLADLTTSDGAAPTSVTLLIVRLEGVYIGGANAGTVQLQWAQNSAVASNLTLKLGSYIDLKRLK